MTARGLLLSLCAALALAACAAPSSQPPVAPAQPTQPAQIADATTAPGAQSTAPVASPTPARDKLRKWTVRTGGPLPPQVVPETTATDRHCDTDADCVVAAVDACCTTAAGTPAQACVNRQAVAAAAAQCTPQAAKTACVAGEVQGCRCVAGSCIAQRAAIDPSIDPAPEQR